MSLNSLPDEIIAKITKKMPHSDRLNLMKTSKRNGRIGQIYRIQYKYIKMKELLVEQSSSNGSTLSLNWIFLTSDDCWLESEAAIMTTIDEFGLILRETWKLEKLTIFSTSVSEFQPGPHKIISSKLINEIVNSRSKISSLRLRDVTFATKRDFCKMSDNFKHITFKEIPSAIEKIQFSNKYVQNISTNPANDDDLFTEEYLLSEKVLEKFLLITEGFSIVNYKSPNKILFNGVGLTDRLLQQVPLRLWPEEFFLSTCLTSFTLNGVLDFIKLADSCKLAKDFDFGFIIVENGEDAVTKVAKLASERNLSLVIEDFETPNSLAESYECSLVQLGLSTIIRHMDLAAYMFTITFIP